MEKTAKSKKEARDEKQKDQKLEEQILKSLEEAGTPEEKFQLLLKKHIESEKGSRRLLQDKKLYEKQLESVLREKENLQREHNKNVLMRDKLQEVCREQQKLIKSVKNESLQKIREEEERRKESQTKFQTSLNEITQSLSKNNDENNKLREHNMEMAKKLQFLAEQYHTREQQLERLNEQVQVESQLHQAKLKKVQVESAMEKEILIKEKQIVLEKLVHSQKLLTDCKAQEEALREQLNLYTTKYDDFQNSLKRSNDIFVTYKSEMEKMSKNSKKLEKECLEWKRKWEKSNASLIELATEKKDRDEHAIRCNRQVEQLQKLLRALQNERTHLYKVIREHNVECPPVPELPPEPEPLQPAVVNNGDKDRMEVMTKNCAELKQTLAYLQTQMQMLSTDPQKKQQANSPVAGVSSKDKKQQPQQQQQQPQQSEDNPKKRSKKKPKSKKENKNVTVSTDSAQIGAVELPTNATATVQSVTLAEEKEMPPAEPIGNENGDLKAENKQIISDMSTPTEEAVIVSQPETIASAEIDEPADRHDDSHSLLEIEATGDSSCKPLCQLPEDLPQTDVPPVELNGIETATIETATPEVSSI